MTRITRFLTLSILTILFAVSTGARASSSTSAHDVAKTTVKPPVAAAPKTEDDAQETKNDGKVKPAPTPKPKPKPGPRDDGDGD